MIESTRQPNTRSHSVLTPYRSPAIQACSIALMLGLLATQSVLARGGPKMPTVEPDYTKGEAPLSTVDPWNLGSTGIFVDLWSGNNSDGATKNTRTMHVNQVDKGSPADGKIQPGDVILGVISPKMDETMVKDGRFNHDVRIAMGAAITEAEKRENRGELVLNVWRAGKTMPVPVQLKVKGSFSATTPYDCEKTNLLIDETAKAILEIGFALDRKPPAPEVESSATGADGGAGGGEGGEGGGGEGGPDAAGEGGEAPPAEAAVETPVQKPAGYIPDYINVLGLLSTGEKQYLPAIQKFVREVAKDSERLDIYGNHGCHIGTWHGGYRNLMMTEYYLATKDPEVLPGIKALSVYISLGQDGVGTWSHGMADVRSNGLYSFASAYGSMNSATVPCVISLILAQKCGIKEEPVDLAVDRSLTFYRWYTDKGCLPYGDHGPKIDHDNNGKNSMAAVMFDLAGDEESARFFARSTVASYNTRESGHTGNFFSMVWGSLGAARGGPLAAQSFVKNTLWMTELERRGNGNYIYQYQLPHDTKKTNFWSTAGARLMQHCLPRKAIHITGKGGSAIQPFTAEEVASCEAAAVYNPAGRTVPQLLEDLGNWSPVVREFAAEELGKREDNVVEPLIAMLDGPNRYARYAACRALFHAGRQSEKAVDALIDKLQNSDDLTLRYHAIQSLQLKAKKSRTAPVGNGLEGMVKKAGPALLKQLAIVEPEKDPMRKLHASIGNLLFYSGRVSPMAGYYPSAKEISQLDRKLLIPALKSLMKNPNGGARSSAAETFEELTEDDLKQLYGDIFVASKVRAPSGVMFGKSMYTKGAVILSDQHFAEALPLAIDMLNEKGWGAYARGPAALKALSKFGALLKPYMPQITEKHEALTRHGGVNQQNLKEIWTELQANLNRETQTQSIRPYLEAAGFDPSILDKKK